MESGQIAAKEVSQRERRDERRRKACAQMQSRFNLQRPVGQDWHLVGRVSESERGQSGRVEASWFKADSVSAQQASVVFWASVMVQSRSSKGGRRGGRGSTMMMGGGPGDGSATAWYAWVTQLKLRPC